MKISSAFSGRAVAGISICIKVGIKLSGALSPTKTQTQTLWSFDFLVFGFTTAVISRTFAMVRFFYFMGWLGH